MIEKKHKKGDIREDGKIYWSRSKYSPTGEVWLTPEKYYKRHNKNNKCARIWRGNNLEKSRKSSLKWKEENKERVLKKVKQWRLNNIEKRREYVRKHTNKRLLSDHFFKLKLSISNLIRMSIKRGGFSKKTKTYNILGCSYDDFKKHIEFQFKDGMSWGNHGKWHYDHIIPISSAKSEEDIIKLNHYTNFQPLWAAENIKKSNKIPATT
jgi:hypothetical protein